MKIRILFLLLLFSMVSLGQNQDMSEALKSYNSGDYDTAIKDYKKILAEGYFSPTVYYNIGNSYYKKGDYGNAMLYYEKALKYSPDDKDILHNIYLVKRNIDSEIIELPDFFLNRWWRSFTNFINLGLWTFLSVLFVVLLAISFGYFWFAKDEKYKRISLNLISIFGLLFILSFFTSMTVKNRIYTNKNAVLIQEQNAYSGSDVRSDTLYSLRPGEKLLIIDSLNNWYQVKLLNKEIVWIEKKGINRI